ncbi:hypothetical protein DRO66_00365 [Candidatus Bathyarchaeota archaeon]|nr:MAG: hypothetical protein DRO66_00365 [Candidatus Bathyarchaeota archaeon]
MKLIFCKSCHDVVKLIIGVKRSCKCGKCSGLYIDKLNAEYEGDDVMPLGFNNFSLKDALNDQPKSGQGMRFDAFVIPEICPTFKKLKKEA